MDQFHLGSLGFLTNFSFESYRPTMTNIIRGEGLNLNIRMRLQCSVYKCRDLIGQATPPEKSTSQATAGAGDVSCTSEDEDAEETNRALALQKKAEILRKVKEMDSKQGAEVADLSICHENGQTLITRIPKLKLEEAFMTPTDTWQVLNEVTLDRGSNAGMLQLELYVDGNPVTTILADGLVIATATGSTAYSVSLEQLE